MLNFGIDWDDVLSPYNQICVDLANKEHSLKLTLDDLKSWGKQEGNAAFVADYYDDPRPYELQTVPEEAKEFIRKLQKKGNVYIITAVPPKFMGIRAAQIKEAFPDFPDSNIILGSEKSIVRFDITLDDGPHNILKSCARFPVLFRRPWNRSLSGLLSVNTYDEFLCLVDQIKNSMVEDKKVPEIPSLVALVGPSGSKKNELSEMLVNAYPDKYCRVKSYTTAPADAYHISVSTEEFKVQDFITKTVYAGDMYGTRYADVKEALESGLCPVMPLDICGAVSMKRLFPTVIIFCKTSRETMIDAILGKDIPNEQKKYRLLSMEKELDNAELCDFVVRTDNETGETAENINNMFLQTEE